MAKTSTAIHTLLELAQRDSEKAAADLSLRNSQLNEAKNQLNQLNAYRQEYVAQNVVLMVSGIESGEILNFRAFLSNLDITIYGQNQIIERSTLAVQEQQIVWQGCERKKMSYQVLTQQEKQKNIIQELKRDQKLTDEFVNSRTAAKSKNDRTNR